MKVRTFGALATPCVDVAPPRWPQSMTDADADADARDFTACDAAVFDCDGTLVGACIGDAMQRARLMTF